MGNKRGAYRVLMGILERERKRGGALGIPGVDGRIILKRILKMWDGEAWTGVIWLRIGTGGGHL
jgi:hypothetical protein